MESAVAWMEPSLDVEKLSREIFSILQNRSLLGSGEPNLFLAAENRPAMPPDASAAGGDRILSGGGSASNGLLARLKAFFRKLSGDPTSRIADFFDLASGSGSGGVLVAMLFVPGPNGQSPVFSADEAHCVLSRNSSQLPTSGEQGFLRKFFQRSGGGGVGLFFRRIFSGATQRDTAKPVLIPCYDPVSGAPFVFSRADALGTGGYDFLMREGGDAACAAPGGMRSVDSNTRIRAVGGVLATRNPTEAAVPHVLNNGVEFPFATGGEDLPVLSLGAGEPEPAGRRPAPPSAADLAPVAGMGQLDVVKEAIAMAFGKNRTTNYIRIQGNDDRLGRGADKVQPAEETLGARDEESVLFRGGKLTERTNGENLGWVTEELIRRHDWSGSRVPTVLIKPTMTPGASCSTTVATVSSTMYAASP